MILLLLVAGAPARFAEPIVLRVISLDGNRAIADRAPGRGAIRSIDQRRFGMNDGSLGKGGFCECPQRRGSNVGATSSRITNTPSNAVDQSVVVTFPKRRDGSEPRERTVARSR